MDGNTAVAGNECCVYYGMLLLHLLLQESNIFSLNVDMGKKKVIWGVYKLLQYDSLRYKLNKNLI